MQIFLCILHIILFSMKYYLVSSMFFSLNFLLIFWSPVFIKYTWNFYLIKPRINISILSSSLNIISSLLPHFLQVIERINVLSKTYETLGFTNLLNLLHYYIQRSIFLLVLSLNFITRNNFFSPSILVSFIENFLELFCHCFHIC